MQYHCLLVDRNKITALTYKSFIRPSSLEVSFLAQFYVSLFGLQIESQACFLY